MAAIGTTISQVGTWGIFLSTQISLMQPIVASRYATRRIRVPMAPLQKNVSKGFAPKNTAQRTAITNTVPDPAPPAGAGVAVLPGRPMGGPGARLRVIANSIRVALTTQARQ